MQQEELNEEISIKQIILKTQSWFNYLLSKWKLILIIGLLGGLLGFLKAYFTKVEYKANYSFALEGEKTSGGLGAYAAIAGQVGIDLGGSGGGIFVGDNLLILLESRSMIEKTLLSTIEINHKKQTLAELYISFNNLREKWTENESLMNISFLPEANRATFSLQQDSLLGVFAKNIIKDNLVVGRNDKKLSVITINFKSKNELFSKFFTERLVENVSYFYTQTKTKRAAENVTILQNQTDSVKRQLGISIFSVAASTDANPDANLARQILKAPTQRRAADVQANQTILTELVKNLEIAKVTLRKETPLIQAIDTPILPLEKEKSGKILGIILGGLLGGVLIVMYLITIKVYKDIMA